MIAAIRRRVVVLVCGERDRGDDGAALRAVEYLPAGALAGAAIRDCGGLEVDHLLAVRPDEAYLVVDAAIGLAPGEIVTRSISSLVAAGERAGRPGSPAPRSTHVLPLSEVLSLAAILRPGLPPGAFVGIGGSSFGFGEELSPAVERALPALCVAIAAEIERLGCVETPNEEVSPGVARYGSVVDHRAL